MKIAYVILVAAFCLFTVTAAAAQDAARITIEPKAIDIGALYNGTTLTATGSVPADSEAIVRFIGTPCDLHMKEKGKVGGVMWMNLDSISFKGVPNVCLVSSAVDLNRLEADGGVSIGVLRLSGLKKSIEIEAQGGGHENSFEELLKLKQKEGLYREMLGNISYASAVDGQKAFSARDPDPLSPYPRRLHSRGRCDKERGDRRPGRTAACGRPGGFSRPALPACLRTLAPLRNSRDAHSPAGRPGDWTDFSEQGGALERRVRRPGLQLKSSALPGSGPGQAPAAL